MNGDDTLQLERFEQQRDEAAFHALYRSHTPRLYALAMRLSAGSRSDAEELVQQAWVRAIQRLDRFERRSSLRTWLSGILVNCYREQSRRRGRAPLELDEETRPRAAATIAEFPPRLSQADPIDVERALARLADGYREVVVLVDVNGCRHREVSEMLGISEGTSKSQLARGRARLRELLSDRPRSGTRRGTS